MSGDAEHDIGLRCPELNLLVVQVQWCTRVDNIASLSLPPEDGGECCRATWQSISQPESESARASPPTSTRFAPLNPPGPRHGIPPGTPPKATGRQQPRPRPHLRASAMLAASLRPGPSLAAFPGTAQRSPVPFLPFPARLHHRPVLLSATAEGTGAPAGQGDASAAPLDEVRLPQVRFLSAS